MLLRVKLLAGLTMQQTQGVVQSLLCSTAIAAAGAMASCMAAHALQSFCGHCLNHHRIILPLPTSTRRECPVCSW